MGFVGGTTAQIFSKIHRIFPYDRYKSPYNNSESIINLVESSQVVFVCVPTPMKKSGEIDYEQMHYSLTLLENTCKEIGRNPKEILITIRSTAVSGTTDSFAEKYPFRFAFNPEFLREKHALEDMQNTNRVVIGANDEESIKKMLDIYRPLFPNADYVITGRKTAEMIKYAANVMLAGQIALANEIYHVCRAVGVDYNAVKDAILLDSRIGRNISVPGYDGDLGFGGKCFPKDLNALIYLARENLYRPYLLEEVWRLNEKVRKNKDWLDIPGATSGNNNFAKDKK